jgi:hypothetical protein
LLVAACARNPTRRASPNGAGFSPIVEPRARFSPITEPGTTAHPTASTSTTRQPAAPSDTATLANLPVAPEDSGAGYSRALFPHWIDADGDGCDTRCEVLAEERRTDLPGIGTGWYSLYDGVVTADPSTFDIDHLVPLAEAWRSGADHWDATRRRDYANDLTDPDALIAVSASSNRSKGDQDPARWLPPNRGSWCEYARDWVEVKVTWGLTADPAEVSALRNLLTSC